MKYQVMPPLSEEEYNALKTDIANNGVLVPIEYDENNNVLDGYHRLKACKELDIKDFPYLIRHGLTEDEKIGHAIRLNCNRRHLTREQKHDKAKELRSQGWSYRRIADVLGIGHSTVVRWLDGDDSGVPNGTPEPPFIIGKDGKGYSPTQKPPSKAIYGMGESQMETTATILEKARRGDMPVEKIITGLATGKITVADAGKTVAKKENRERAEKINVSVESRLSQKPDRRKEINTGEWWRLGDHFLYCGDTSDPEFVNRLPDAEFAFADPPYNAGVEEWDQKFSWNHDWLIGKSRTVVVTPGIVSIFDFARRTSMPYLWSIACWITNGMTRGALGFGNWIYGAVFSNKSIHRNSQDFLKVTINIADTSETDHRGRKPAGLLVWLIETFTKTGDIVIDPFLGSGTTLLVAEEMGRICYGGEINPGYCAEIIARWEEMTGKEAVME